MGPNSAQIIAVLRRLLTVNYSPDPKDRSFLARAQKRTDCAVEVTVAVLSDRESERVFGVPLSSRRLQAVWLDVVNGSNGWFWLDRVQIDPDYCTPLEAAQIMHFSIGRRLVAFGLLGWLFLPVLPLIPLKLLGARAVNRGLDGLFRSMGFPTGVIAAGQKASGFLFTGLDEAVKRMRVRLLSRTRSLEFPFTVEVPGLSLSYRLVHKEPAAQGGEDLDEAGFRAWIDQLPRSTSNAQGTVEGDPLNLVIVGDLATILDCLSAWDETESLTFRTAWKTARAFLLESQYRYSPVSPLYLDGRQQDIALQRARLRLNQRLHMRLWTTNVRFDSCPVWIGQVSRDIGVRLTPKTWNLTTHLIDPDVDEARNYVLNDLLLTERVARIGWLPGVEAAPVSAPRRNLTGDQYFTDGLRAVAVLSSSRTTPSYL
jgi:hypothetical protein